MISSLNDFDYGLCSIYGIPFYKFKFDNFEEHQKTLIDFCLSGHVDDTTTSADVKFRWLKEEHDRKVFDWEKVTKNISSNVIGHEYKSSVANLHSTNIAEEVWRKFDSGSWLMDVIYDCLGNIIKDNKGFTIYNSWFVYTKGGSGGWNLPHTHPGCFLASAFYLKTSKNCGNYFAIGSNSSIDSLFEGDSQIISYAPVEGEMIFFPASVVHMVGPNMSDADRLSISFNIVHKANVESLDSSPMIHGIKKDDWLSKK